MSEKPLPCADGGRPQAAPDVSPCPKDAAAYLPLPSAQRAPLTGACATTTAATNDSTRVRSRLRPRPIGSWALNRQLTDGTVDDVFGMRDLTARVGSPCGHGRLLRSVEADAGPWGRKKLVLTGDERAGSEGVRPPGLEMRDSAANRGLKLLGVP